MKLLCVQHGTNMNSAERALCHLQKRLELLDTAVQATNIMYRRCIQPFYTFLNDYNSLGTAEKWKHFVVKFVLGLMRHKTM